MTKRKPTPLVIEEEEFPVHHMEDHMLLHGEPSAALSVRQRSTDGRLVNSLLSPYVVSAWSWGHDWWFHILAWVGY